jgi:CheY-like chemotaxis protein
VALRILERLGYRADVAGNGLEALEAVQRQPYDLILMDIQMPEMDGVEATQQIRDLLPPQKQPYIVAMTAHALVGDRERYLNKGMDGYISKPVHIEDLIEVLQETTPLPGVQPNTGLLTPRPPVPDDKWPINVAALKRIIGPEAVAQSRSLIPIYLEDSERLVQMSHNALEQESERVFVQSIHSLKGNSASLAVNSIAELCQKVEALVREKGIAAPAVSQHFAALEEEHERVSRALAEMVEEEMSH